MMLVYGTAITKLPFIDERSLVAKPIINLQNYFVSKWQENLPNDDAEKYLSWYMFEYMSYILPRIGIVLYKDNIFTFEETREINDKIWNILQSLRKHQAKDDVFNKMRYSAFLNLSSTYVINFTAYWVEIRDGKPYLNGDTVFTDDGKFKELIKLYDDIRYMNEYYQKNYPSIYNNLHHKGDYWTYSGMHEFTVLILQYFAKTKHNKYVQATCKKENSYLNDYYISKKWLLDNNEILKAQQIDIGTSLSQKADEAIALMCGDKNINEEISYGK